MKNKLLLLILLTITITLQSVSALTANITFTTYDGYMYNMTTGKYTANENWNVTSKMEISPYIDGNNITLGSTNFHHMLFFDKYNRLIGYINGNGSTYQNDKYLGYDATAVTTVPSGTKTFVIQNYNYDITREQVAWSNTGSVQDEIPQFITQKPSKNLLEIGDIYFQSTPLIVTTATNKLEIQNQNAGWNYVSYRFYLDQNTDYFISAKFQNTFAVTWSTISVRDTSGLVLAEVQNGTDMAVGFNTGTNTYVDIRFYIDNDTDDLASGYYYDIMLEQSSTATTYEPYVTFADWNTYQSLTYDEIFGANTRYGGANNYIPNGDFSDTLSGWGNAYSSISIENGLLKVVGDGTNVVTRANYGYPSNTTDGDYLYISGDVMTTNSNVVQIKLFDGYTLQGGVIINPNANQWYNIKTVRTSSQLSTLFFDIQYSSTTHSNGGVSYLDNIKVYNLTDIFKRGLEPTAEQMEQLYLYWETYNDNPVELTYNDIFGANTQYGGANNLIDNGDFSNGITSWNKSGGSTSFTIENGKAKVQASSLTYSGIYQLVDILQSKHIYYHSFDSWSDNADSFTYQQISLDNYLSQNIIYTLNRIEKNSGLYTATGVEDRFQFYLVNGGGLSSSIYHYFDNILLYDLTAIFSDYLEPSIAEFEAYYDIWTDPLDANYSVYYSASSQSLLTLSYSYTIPNPVEQDADSNLNNFLANIGFDNETNMIFLSIAIIVGVMIASALISKDFTITLTASGIAYLVLGIIGWVSLVYLIVAVIILIAYVVFTTARG